MSWQQLTIKEQQAMFEEHLDIATHTDTYMLNQMDYSIYVQLRDEGIRVYVINEDDQLLLVFQHG